MRLIFYNLILFFPRLTCHRHSKRLLKGSMKGLTKSWGSTHLLLYSATKICPFLTHSFCYSFRINGAFSSKPQQSWRRRKDWRDTLALGTMV